MNTQGRAALRRRRPRASPDIAQRVTTVLCAGHVDLQVMPTCLPAGTVRQIAAIL